MAAPTTVDALIGLVRKSNLVPREKLDAYLVKEADTMSRDPRSQDPNALATRLVQVGLITHFQAEQFLLGKWRGFTIGRYRVLERLGFGGTGTVYLAEHLTMRRRVAIKVLPISKADNPSALGRFYREARAAGGLDHPNLVKAHDIDQENGLHYLVMEYVDGISLQDLIVRFGPLSSMRAAHYISQAAQGLQAAHVGGLIHRDIKPANILLDRHGVIRVLDLGLARFHCDDEEQLTLKYDEKHVLGTVDYVAPEQALNSHAVDIRADIYSLGATCYFLLLGQPPFAGGKAGQKLIWHQTRMPTPLCQLRAEVSAELSAFVQRMLAKDPGQRPQTPAEVVEALAPWTRTPIPPPCASEMPRLSPAVQSQTAEVDVAGAATPTPRSGPWSRAITASTPVPPLPGPPRLKAPLAPMLRQSASPMPAAARPAPPPEKHVMVPPVIAPSTQLPPPEKPVALPIPAPARSVRRPHRTPPRTTPRKAVWITLVVLASALLGLGARFSFPNLRRGAPSPPVIEKQVPNQPGDMGGRTP